MTNSVIPVDYLREFFRIEFLRQRGGPDQVAKHDRQMPAFEPRWADRVAIIACVVARIDHELLTFDFSRRRRETLPLYERAEDDTWLQVDAAVTLDDIPRILAQPRVAEQGEQISGHLRLLHGPAVARFPRWSRAGTQYGPVPEYPECSYISAAGARLGFAPGLVNR